MNKYWLLIFINTPLVVTGIVRAITRFKTKPARISRTKCIVEVLLWLAIGAGLFFMEPLFNTLINHNLTNSQPMSLFDVGLLTLFIFGLLLIIEANEEITALKRTVSRLHEEMVIRGAEDDKKSA